MLDIPHCDRFDSEGVVNEDLAVDSECLIKPFLVPLCPLCNITHREEAVPLEGAGLSGANHPEVREGPVIPEKVLVAVFIELCNPDAVFVGGGVLCYNVHRDLCEVEVGSDADGCGDSGGVEDIPNDCHGHDMRRVCAGSVCFGLVQVQIRCRINERLINGINVHILRRGIAEDDRINPGADLFIERHPGNSDLVGYLCAMGSFIILYRPFRFE